MLPTNIIRFATNELDCGLSTRGITLRSPQGAKNKRLKLSIGSAYAWLKAGLRLAKPHKTKKQTDCLLLPKNRFTFEIANG